MLCRSDTTPMRAAMTRAFHTALILACVWLIFHLLATSIPRYSLTITASNDNPDSGSQHTEDNIILEQYVRTVMMDNRGNFSADAFVRPDMWNYGHTVNRFLSDPSLGHAEKILDALGSKTQGLFVEVGGGDGETYSATLHLERWYGWTGIILESDRAQYEHIVNTNRRAVLGNFFAASVPFPHKTFRMDMDGMDSELADAFPLYTVMRAWNMTKVDLLYLDTNGEELSILAGLPWHMVNISLIVVDLGPSRRWMFKEIVSQTRKLQQGISDSYPLQQFLPEYFSSLGYSLVDELHDKFDDDYFFLRALKK